VLACGAVAASGCRTSPARLLDLADVRGWSGPPRHRGGAAGGHHLLLLAAGRGQDDAGPAPARLLPALGRDMALETTMIHWRSTLLDGRPATPAAPHRAARGHGGRRHGQHAPWRGLPGQWRVQF
jgi:predicted ATPase with chaperone activity